MPRRVLPPDFRYVWLHSGPRSAALTIGAAAAGIVACGAGLMSQGQISLPAALSVGAGITAMLAWSRWEGTTRARPGAREVNMAIVPWGIVITPDTEPRVLRWAAIRRVTVDITHALRGGTPLVLASLVTIETDREILAGRTAGSAELERLVANLEAYAEEATRPLACDLEGTEPAVEDATEPAAASLARHAIALCTTSSGAARLSLPPGGYRTVSTATAAPETVETLRGVLHGEPRGPCDPRAIAAIVAALLGATDLVPDVMRLVTSPHPLLAAIAKAAAVRLGAPRNRAGCVDEVAAFLFDEDLAMLRGWADTGAIAAR